MSLRVKILKLLNPTLSTTLRQRGARAVEETGQEMKTLVDQRVVVWTGALRRSMTLLTIGPFRRVIQSTLRYAYRIHSDRPFVKDAKTAILPRWTARLTNLYGGKASLPPMPVLERYPSRMAMYAAEKAAKNAGKYAKYIV